MNGKKFKNKPTNANISVCNVLIWHCKALSLFLGKPALNSWRFNCHYRCSLKTVLDLIFNNFLKYCLGYALLKLLNTIYCIFA